MDELAKNISEHALKKATPSVQAADPLDTEQLTTEHSK